MEQYWTAKLRVPGSSRPPSPRTPRIINHHPHQQSSIVTLLIPSPSRFIHGFNVDLEGEHLQAQARLHALRHHRQLQHGPQSQGQRARARPRAALCGARRRAPARSSTATRTAPPQAATALAPEPEPESQSQAQSCIMYIRYSSWGSVRFPSFMVRFGHVYCRQITRKYMTPIVV